MTKEHVESLALLAFWVWVLFAAFLSHCAPMPDAPVPDCITRCYHVGPACPPGAP